MTESKHPQSPLCPGPLLFQSAGRRLGHGRRPRRGVGVLALGIFAPNVFCFYKFFLTLTFWVEEQEGREKYQESQKLKWRMPKAGILVLGTGWWSPISRDCGWRKSGPWHLLRRSRQISRGLCRGTSGVWLGAREQELGLHSGQTSSCRVGPEGGNLLRNLRSEKVLA